MYYLPIILFFIITFLVLKAIKYYLSLKYINRNIKLYYEDHNIDLAAFFPLRGKIVGRKGGFFNFYLVIKLDQDITYKSETINKVYIKERLAFNVIQPKRIIQVFLNIEKGNNLELIVWASVEVL